MYYDKRVNSYKYDAWGTPVEQTESIQNRFKFNGQQYDPISQQYYLRARYYNPVIARFTQEDSYRGDGLNLYAYCKNNPVMYTKSNTTAGNFISKTSHFEIAREFAGKNGYIYILKTNNYIDINMTYGSNALFPEQFEFAIPGGIKQHEII
ncbi:MAG: hypothetical protein ATN35_06010 [Epulopiscium sp. Nele67-Bin004]|nr:MAG: hypothetical protein ATN35_06010 [Epulopiscium sp. Nele67-Bin004]